MTSRSSRWVSAIGAVVVGGGLVLVGSGSGVTPAGAAPSDNPLTVLSAKLDQILADSTTDGSRQPRVPPTVLLTQ